MEQTQQHLSMRTYGRMIKKRWKVVLAFAIIGLILGIVSFLTSPKAYRASSEVLIERPSGYVISAAASGLGSAVSTKQQLQFLDTTAYRDMARSLTELAPPMHLDMQDRAVVNDISSVIQNDVLNSAQVTPVRLVLYDLPAPSLLSYQQERTIIETPALFDAMTKVGHMTMGPNYSVTTGWRQGHSLDSDRAVWANMAPIARSSMMQSWQSLGITDKAASDAAGSMDESAQPHLVTGTRIRLAAQIMGALSELDTKLETDKARGRNITSMTSSPDVLKAVGEIMQSSKLLKIADWPQSPNWFALSPAERFQKLSQVRESWVLYKQKYPTKEDAVWDVSGKEQTEGSDMIQVSQTAPSPAEARLAANAMAAVMVWEDRMTKVADAERSVRFLTSTLGSAVRDLRLKEDAVTNYQKSHALVDPTTQLKLAAENAATLESEKGQLDAQIKQTQATLGKYHQQFGGIPTSTISPTIKQNPLVEAIKGDIVKAQTTLAGLQTSYTDDWPAVQEQKAQLNLLQNSLKQQVATSISQQYAPDPIHYEVLGKITDATAQIVGLQARRDAIGGLVSQMNGKFARLPDTQAEMVRLIRTQSIAERQYMDLTARLLDAKNNRAMRQGNARAVDLAAEPGEKVAPRMRNVLVAMLLGAFFGCLCALALSTTDTHLHTAEDVRRELNLPVLAHLPAIPHGNTLVVEAMPVAAVTEGFRALRSTIRFMGGDKPVRTLTATSTKAAEGKSTVVANLAASLAQAGLTVTAVDADLRRPRLASFFGIPSGVGLTDALSGAKPARQTRQATRIPGLYVVPSGAAPSNPGELLDNGRIGKALDELAEGCDMVIVDTPPIGVVTDAALVGSATDATILVMESGTVEPDEARAAVAKLVEHARANVIGVVLVGGDAPMSEDYVRYVNVANGNGNGGGNGYSGGAKRRQGRERVES